LILFPNLHFDLVTLLNAPFYPSIHNQPRYFEDRAITTLCLVCPAKGEVLAPLRAQHHHHTAVHSEQEEATAAAAAAAAGGGYRMLEEPVSFGKGNGKGKLFLAYRKAGAPLGLCEVTFKGGACFQNQICLSGRTSH
jgi:hypothetical protein